MTLTAAIQSPLGHNNPPATPEDTLSESLKVTHEKHLSHAAALMQAADRIPAEITDAETAGKAADFIKQVNGSKKNLEAIRVNEKEPYLKLGRLVDGFFKTVTDNLDVAKNKAQRPLDAYAKAVAAAEQRRRAEEAAKARSIQEEQMRIAAAMEAAQQTETAAAIMDAAVIQEQTANRLDKEAEARPAELSRTRTETGALASLRTVWVGEIVDITTLDLNQLRHHISPAALQTAINSFVKAGGRELAGAKIFEQSNVVVR